MTRLERARECLNTPWESERVGHDWWSWLLIYAYDDEHRVYASLILDGYPARWPRVCLRCAPGWGHNAGGIDSILRHKPVTSALGQGQGKAQRLNPIQKRRDYE